MKAYCIILAGHPYSEAVGERCVRSAAEVGGVEVEPFDATPADQAEAVLRWYGLRWTWMVENHTNLRHHRYGGHLARIGCAMSHYRLWRWCAETGLPALILEHDAVFLRKFEPFPFASACMINDPAGATRKGQWWSEQMKRRGPGVWPKTRLPQDPLIPDGLAGNSAYVLQPECAEVLIDLYARLGVWPNDATMCEQLVPGLQEVYPFVTRVEQSISTTGSV